jgi:hypothetical protein
VKEDIKMPWKELMSESNGCRICLAAGTVPGADILLWLMLRYGYAAESTNSSSIQKNSKKN